MLIDPGPRRKGRVGKLPGGEHDLTELPVYLVAVVVHIHEFIISADFLKLAVGSQEGGMVPETKYFLWSDRYVAGRLG